MRCMIIGRRRLASVESSVLVLVERNYLADELQTYFLPGTQCLVMKILWQPAIAQTQGAVNDGDMHQIGTLKFRIDELDFLMSWINHLPPLIPSRSRPGPRF